jgi:hypothetical protein
MKGSGSDNSDTSESDEEIDYEGNNAISERLRKHRLESQGKYFRYVV